MQQHLTGSATVRSKSQGLCMQVHVISDPVRLASHSTTVSTHCALHIAKQTEHFSTLRRFLQLVLQMYLQTLHL